MDYPVQPLYRLLQFWHFSMTLQGLMAIADDRKRIQKPKTANEISFRRPLSSHLDFEKSLLQSQSEDFDWARFIGLSNREEIDWSDHSPGELELLWVQQSIPGMVSEWSRHSRRVYTIPEDLQLLLASTSLKGIDCSNLRFPFRSFLLNLAVPLEGPDGVLYDSILVSQEHPRWKPGTEGDSTVTATIIPSVLPSIASDLPISKHQKLSKLARNGEPGEAAYDIERFWLKNKRIPRPKLIFDLETITQTELLVESLEALEGDGMNSFSGGEITGAGRHLGKIVGRILFGFISYLQSTPVCKTQAETFETHGAQKLPRQAHVVADEAKVCHVQSVYKLDAEERVIFRGVMHGTGGYEVSPHHREGHWRRPPGKGSDPTAKKTVWIRPTIVRRDRLKPGELPGGTEKVA